MQYLMREGTTKMRYDSTNYLSSKEYAKACKTPIGCVKLMGASYTKASLIDESSFFRGFGINQGMYTTLYSYGTSICDWCADVLIISLDAFHYSNTTCRHLSVFLKRYTPLDYPTLKAVYDYEDPIPGQVVKIEDVTVMFV